MAEGETQLSGTTDFLKSTLAKASEPTTAQSMRAGDPTFSSPRRGLTIKRDLTPTQALSNPRAIAARNTLAPVNGVKLRPFVAGRKLPTKAELESGFTAMAPQFDNGSDQSNLSASVSESAYMARPDSREYSTAGYESFSPTDARTQNRARLKAAARVASGYDRRSAPRSLPGQSPATPGQVGFPCAQQAVADMQPVRAASGGNDWGQLAQDIKAHGFSPDMQAAAQKMAANNGADLAQPPASTAGPAPFPLSLLPEASLKQFIGTTAAPGKHPQPGAPSYFGMWKQGQTVVGRAPLQPSGFHSNLGGGGSHGQSHMLVSSAFGNYAPMSMSGRRAAPMRPVEGTAAKHIAQNVHPSTTVHVATYGPYVSHVTY